MLQKLMKKEDRVPEQVGRSVTEPLLSPESANSQVVTEDGVDWWPFLEAATECFSEAGREDAIIKSFKRGKWIESVTTRRVEGACGLTKMHPIVYACSVC